MVVVVVVIMAHVYVVVVVVSSVSKTSNASLVFTETEIKTLVGYAITKAAKERAIHSSFENVTLVCLVLKASIDVNVLPIVVMVLTYKGLVVVFLV